MSAPIINPAVRDELEKVLALARDEGVTVRILAGEGYWAVVLEQFGTNRRETSSTKTLRQTLKHVLLFWERRR